jgi:hypothetical protein
MYHEVVVTRTIVDKKGFDKSVTEKYYTENKEFLAESEQALMEFWNGECEVTSVKQSKIREFVNNRIDDEQDIYLCTIESVFVDENEEEKATKYVVGVFAKSVEEATRIVIEYMKMGIEDMSITSITRTKIVELIK